MKTSKLLEKLGNLTSTAPQLDKERLKKLRKVVKELKAKEKRLEKERRREKDPDERHRLKMAIQVVHTQRKKGVEVYKGIKQASRSKQPAPEGGADLSEDKAPDPVENTADSNTGDSSGG